jgi:uncharacterized protein (UPF0335 family)
MGAMKELLDQRLLEQCKWEMWELLQEVHNSGHSGNLMDKVILLRKVGSLLNKIERLEKE